MVMSAVAHAASAPHETGQISPLPSAFAPMAAGSAPATAAIDPSSDNAFRGQREADRVQRPAHPLAALPHGLVGKADDGEGGKPRADLD
jgi:hypothetical protein